MDIFGDAPVLSKLPSDFRSLRGLLAFMRFNGSRFRSTERNAYILRNTLSDCVFLGSRTFEYAPRRKALSFASCLYLRVLTGDGFAWNGRNANIRRNTLSPLRFAPLCNGAAPLTSCLPFLTKGRCRAERDGGDKKIVDDMGRDLTRDFFGKNRTDNPSVSCADSSLCTREP